MSSKPMRECAYADGNGNVFLITIQDETYLEYKPVRREESSSGEYDGGKPVRKKLTSDEWAKIKSLIDAAVSNKTIRIENRVMGSGLISISEGSDTKIYFIRGNSTEAVALESCLRTFLQ